MGEVGAVCKPKEEGGLGVKNLEWFNLSFLAKWRWRLLKEEKRLWRDVVVSRYGNNEGGLSLSLWEGNVERLASPWWKRICKLGRYESMEDWFKMGVKRKLGKGNKIKFWDEVWLGNLFLGYIACRGIERVIEELGKWQGMKWKWMLSWRRVFFFFSVGRMHWSMSSTISFNLSLYLDTLMMSGSGSWMIQGPSHPIRHTSYCNQSVA